MTATRCWCQPEWLPGLDNEYHPWEPAEMELCTGGVVRRGSMHHGTDYPCTGSAHHAGMHIRCTSAVHALAEVANPTGRAAMTHDLPDFVIPIPSGLEPCEETDLRLPPEVEAEVDRKLKEFARARAQAIANSHGYVVWR